MTDATHAEAFKIHFTPFGIPLNIDHSVIFMWAVSDFIIIIVMVATRVRVMQQVEHYLYEFVQNQFMKNLKPKNPLWFSFITTLFLFILFCNLAGLVPGSNSPTGDISVTVALALMIFFLSILIGIIAHGFGFLKQFVPENVPIFLLPFMIVLEFLSYLTRPFSLAVRLFANMFAGHMILTIFLGFVIVLNPYLKLIPLIGVIMVTLFKVFVALIQAFIFTYLATLYIGEALHGKH